MHYHNVIPAVFLERVNRFIARVLIAGDETRVHVRNTGRCRELLVPGAAVLIEASPRPERKTAWTLIAVYKGDRLVNIDSLAPNRLVFDALLDGGLPSVGRVDSARREVTYGRSRFDLYFETGGRGGFIEVKGVTLERDGLALFPDAPTGRGARHIAELIAAAAQGYSAYIIFVIQMKGVSRFTANAATDPAFAAALKLAARQGVGVLAYDSLVALGETHLGDPVPVVL